VNRSWKTHRKKREEFEGKYRGSLQNRETGDYESQTTWHRCVVFGPQAALAATLLKGAHVLVEGELRTREYSEKPAGKKSTPVKKTAAEIRVFRVVKLDRAGKSASEGAAA
jgi:single-strand DNA-binding protein